MDLSRVHINQVSTLLCNQTCQLDVKFMQHCCKWTNGLFMWHHHKWTSACFCMPSACSMQSIFDLVHALLCNWTVNLWISSCDIVAIKMCTDLSLPFIRAGPLMITICCIQQQLLTEELFSQLPMYLLLKHHCNNRMKCRLSTWLLHKLNFWVCEFVKKKCHSSCCYLYFQNSQLINCTGVRP